MGGPPKGYVRWCKKSFMHSKTPVKGIVLLQLRDRRALKGGGSTQGLGRQTRPAYGE